DQRREVSLVMPLERGSGSSVAERRPAAGFGCAASLTSKILRHFGFGQRIFFPSRSDSTWNRESHSGQRVVICISMCLVVAVRDTLPVSYPIARREETVGSDAEKMLRGGFQIYARNSTTSRFAAAGWCVLVGQTFLSALPCGRQECLPHKKFLPQRLPAFTGAAAGLCTDAGVCASFSPGSTQRVLWRKNVSGLSWTILRITSSPWPRRRISRMKSGTASGFDRPQSPAEFAMIRSVP